MPEFSQLCFLKQEKPMASFCAGPAPASVRESHALSPLLLVD
jgi:hypothetical protein